MQWISDLVKHLGVSKFFAFAVFTTSAALLFGPHYWPSQIPNIKDVWRVIAFATLTFSGTYLFLWLLHWLLCQLNRTKNAFWHWRHSSNITTTDERFIELIATQPSETLNLMLMNYEGQEFSRIELIQYAKYLSKTGLVKISLYDDAIISLTERGKQYASRIAANRRSSQKNS